MSGYIGNIPTPQATQTRQTFTATAGQTSFATLGYTPNFVSVYLNGVKLIDGTDYTATNGSDIVLTSAAALNDTLEMVAFTTFEANSQNFTGDFSVDTDTLYVDSTNNRVGVGTSSPSDTLDVTTSTNGTPTRIRLTANDTGGTARSGNVFFDADTNTVGFRNGGSNVLHVDSSDNVGIGTSSPAAVLHVNSNLANLAGLFESNDAGATITLIDNSTTGGSVAEHGLNTVGDQLELRAVDNLAFETAATERMRIDSSGNVLVGTTTSPSGSNQIVASGGVYLGGTTSDNLLDDYEEGTWTPDVQDNSGNSASTSSAIGLYTKTGDIVTAFMRVIDINKGGLTAGDAIRVYGLPYTASGIVRYGGSAIINTWTGTTGLITQIIGGNTFAQFKTPDNGNALVSEITNGSADIYAQVTYKV